MGASHTGKTKLAQKLLEKYKYPYLSIDHLKMGLIRSGHTELTAMSSDEELTDLLWPIISEMIKTAIENKQNLIVEGCYISFDWKKDFEKEYLENIKIFSENLILNSNSIDECLDYYVNSMFNLNDRELKLALIMTSLKRNYEVFNEENFKKLKLIACTMIDLIKEILSITKSERPSLEEISERFQSELSD